MQELSAEQHSIVIGSLLGDGAMRCKANALLEINHCLQQKVYVDYKYRVLANLVRTPPKERAGNGTRRAYRFTTLSLPELTTYYRKFYQDGRKVIPEVSLDPLAMAVWLMDDGCKSRTSVYLNTQQFDDDSNNRLVRTLKNQWNIAATLNRDKIYLRIRIAVESIPRLRALVSPHVLPEFAYKLP